MGIITAGIFLYGAHLLAKNYYGDEYVKKGKIALSQSLQQDYASIHSSQAYSPNNQQQSPLMFDLKSGSTPETCACSAEQQKKTYAPVFAQDHKN